MLVRNRGRACKERANCINSRLVEAQDFLFLLSI
jgi:hypothetical protein